MGCDNPTQVQASVLLLLILEISPCKKFLALYGDKNLSYVPGNLFLLLGELYLGGVMTSFHIQSEHVLLRHYQMEAIVYLF